MPHSRRLRLSACWRSCSVSSWSVAATHHEKGTEMAFTGTDGRLVSLSEARADEFFATLSLFQFLGDLAETYRQRLLRRPAIETLTDAVLFSMVVWMANIDISHVPKFMDLDGDTVNACALAVAAEVMSLARGSDYGEVHRCGDISAVAAIHDPRW